MATEMTDHDLQELLNGVTESLGELLKKEVSSATASLHKASPGESIPPEMENSASSTAPTPPQSAPEGSSGGPDGSPDGAPAPADGSPEGQETPEAPAPEGEVPEDGQGPVDPAELQAEYSKLPVEELKTHYLAAKAALVAAMGQSDGSAGGPEASGAPAPMAPPEGAPPAIKAEFSAGCGSGGEKVAVKKSGDILATLQKRIAEQDEMIQGLGKAVKIMIEKPLRKAVTSVSFIAKEGEASNDLSKMSREDVKAKLSHVAETTRLSKSDQQSIMAYCLDKAPVEKVAHLFSTFTSK